MTREERARRYLQASRDAGYTNLPQEHVEAAESLMREHERRYPQVREHAIVGADQDFDKPLSAGEREYQRHLRGEEGLTHGQVLERRKAIRSGEKPTRPRPKSTGTRRAAARAGFTGARAYRRAARPTGLPGVAGDAGSLTLQLIGVGIMLALAYLVLSDKGSKAFGAILRGLSSALRMLIGPVDPLGGNPSLEQALARERQKAKTEGPSTRIVHNKHGAPVEVPTYAVPAGG
jgi:hypothetical protein